MNRFFLIFALLFSISFSQGQKNVKKYYEYVNKAELAICKSKYQAASKYYEKAFKYHKPFRRDLALSFKINYKYIENYELAIQNFIILAQTGIDDLTEIIDDTIKYQVMWKYIKNIVDTTKLTLNMDLVSSINTMRHDDQSVRLASYDNDTLRSQAIYRTDSVNYKKILEIYEKYSSINEYTAKTVTPLYFILLHNSRYGYDPKEIWFEEVKKGNIDARTYMELEDQCKTAIIDKMEGINNDPIYGTNYNFIFAINNTLFIFEPENINEIEKNRNEIYISETWNDYIKKVKYIYFKQNQDFHFLSYKTIIDYSMTSEELIEKLKKEIDENQVKGVYFEIKNPFKSN
jgi:hypothetical protein